MKTQREKVEGTCYVWALPKTDWEISQDLDEVDGDMAQVMPFRYTLTTHESHYRDDAVLVHEFAVATMLPEGIDLLKAAVETLRAEIVRVREEAEKKVEQLQEKINKLALIEYKPEGFR